MHYFYGFMAIVFVSIVLLLFYNETIKNIELLNKLKSSLIQNNENESNLEEYKKLLQTYSKQYRLLKPFAKFIKIPPVETFDY